MTAPDFRDRLEALLGPVHTVPRAAAALGCDRRSVYRWLDPKDRAPVPDWAIRHVETVEFVHRYLGRSDAETVLPQLWWQKSPLP